MITLILVSLCLGSFLNNIISYYINESDLDLLRSRCHCGSRTLKWYELIPVISYVVNRSKCNICKNKLPARYLISEIISPIIVIICYFSVQSVEELFLDYFILLNLYVIGIVDYYTLKIPNVFILSLLAIILIKVFVVDDISFDAVIRITIIIAIGWTINSIYQRWKQIDALGYGDIKFIAIMGIILNGMELFLSIWIASIVALVLVLITNNANLMNNETKIPFASYLSFGFSILLLFPTNITDFYNIYL